MLELKKKEERSNKELLAMEVVLGVVCISICIAIEIKVGYYECPECGHKYVPSFKSYILATHIGCTRKMVCPNCGKKVLAEESLCEVI